MACEEDVASGVNPESNLPLVQEDMLTPSKYQCFRSYDEEGNVDISVKLKRLHKKMNVSAWCQLDSAFTISLHLGVKHSVFAGNNI